ADRELFDHLGGGLCGGDSGSHGRQQGDDRDAEPAWGCLVHRTHREHPALPKRYRRGSNFDTVSLPLLATQRLVPSKAMPIGESPTGTTPTTSPSAGRTM